MSRTDRHKPFKVVMLEQGDRRKVWHHSACVNNPDHKRNGLFQGLTPGQAFQRHLESMFADAVHRNKVAYENSGREYRATVHKRLPSGMYIMVYEMRRHPMVALLSDSEKKLLWKHLYKKLKKNKNILPAGSKPCDLGKGPNSDCTYEVQWDEARKSFSTKGWDREWQDFEKRGNRRKTKNGLLKARKTGDYDSM